MIGPSIITIHTARRVLRIHVSVITQKWTQHFAEDGVMVNGRPKIDFQQKYWHWWTILEHFQWSVLWNDFANTLQIISNHLYWRRKSSRKPAIASSITTSVHVQKYTEVFSNENKKLELLLLHFFIYPAISQATPQFCPPPSDRRPHCRGDCKWLD